MSYWERLLFAVITCIFFGGAAFAQENQGKNTVAGAGTVLCGEALEQIEQGAPLDTLYISWMQGFLSGINFALQGQSGNTLDLSSGHESHFRWVRNWCEENALDSFNLAVRALFVELVNRQIKEQ